MKRLWKGIAIAVAAFLMIPSLVALAYSWYIDFTVTESSGNAYTSLPIGAPAANDYYAANGYISATGLNTRVYDSGNSTMPHMLTEDTTWFAAAQPASNSQVFRYAMGETALSAFKIIPGYSGNITTSDNANLELGSDFNVSASGYFDTSSGSNKYIARKNGAILIYVSGNQEITAQITGASGNYSAVAAGVASGFHTIEVWSDGAAARIEVDGVTKDTEAFVSGAVSPTDSPYYIGGAEMVYATAHDAANSTIGFSYIGQWNQAGAYAIQRVGLAFDTSAIPDTSDIISANITGSIGGTTITSNHFDFTIVSGAGLVDAAADYGTLLSATTDYGHINTADMPLSPTSYAIDLNATGVAQISKTGTTRFGIRGSNDINSNPVPGLNEYQRVAPDGVFTLNVTYGVAVTDTSDNWTWMENNVMSYADNITIDVNGVRRLTYLPDSIILGTNLPDESGNGNDGTFNWGTNPVGVTVASGPLVGGNPAHTPTPPTAPWELVPTVPAAPADLFTEGGECMPGLAELADASEATGNPRAMFPIMLAFGLAILAGFGVYGATHNSRAGQRGSIFLQSVTSLAVLIFFYVGGCGVIPGWVIIPFGLEAVFLLVGRNPQHSST